MEIELFFWKCIYLWEDPKTLPPITIAKWSKDVWFGNKPTIVTSYRPMSSFVISLLNCVNIPIDKFEDLEVAHVYLLTTTNPV